MPTLLPLTLALAAPIASAGHAAIGSMPVRPVVPAVPAMDFHPKTGDPPSRITNAAAENTIFGPPGEAEISMAGMLGGAQAIQIAPPWTGAMESYSHPTAQTPPGAPAAEADRPERPAPTDPPRERAPQERGSLERFGKALEENPGGRPAALAAFWDAAHFQGQMRNELELFGPLERGGTLGVGEILGQVQAESRMSFMIENVTFVIDPDLLRLVDRDLLRSWVQSAIEEARSIRGEGFSAELKSLEGRSITLALVDRSSHLMEYHSRLGADGGQERLIGINRGLFDKISSPRAQWAIFGMGLTHELRHAAGKDKSPAAEIELSEQDAAMFRRLIAEQDVEQTLAELSALLEGDSLFLFELNKSNIAHVHGDYLRGIFAADFDPKGGKVATVGWSGKVQVWDRYGGGIILAQEDGTGGNIFALGFEHGGSRIAVGGGDGGVLILDEKNARRLSAEPLGPDEVTAVSFSRDDRLVAAGTHSGLVRVWKLADSSLSGTLRHARPVRSLAFSLDGRDLATVDADGVVRRHADFEAFTALDLGPLEPEERSASAKVADQDRRYGVAFSPDSRLLAASGPGGHIVRVWQTETGRVALRLKRADRPNWVIRLTFSGDGKLLAGADEGGQVNVWEAASGRLLFRHRFEDAVMGLRFELGTHLLIVFDRDGNITEVLIRDQIAKN